MKKFSEQIAESINKYNLLITKVFQDSCYLISGDIAMDSPVSTGTLLGKWSPSKNEASSNSYIGGMPAWQNVGAIYWKDESIAAQNRVTALANLTPRIKEVTGSLSKNDTYHFTNNTEYIKQAEYDGWINTDAYHMRANAIQNWQLTVNSAAEALYNE